MSAGFSKTSLPGEFKQLARVGTSMIRSGAPARKLLLSQLSEALSTGGVNARIPMIQQAVSRSNQAAANAMSQTAEQLASRNIGGPFAQRIMAGQNMAANQQAAAIPTQMAQQMINQTTPFLSATSALGMGALAQAGQADMTVDQVNAQMYKAFMQDLKDSMMGMGSAAMCLHPAALVATPGGSVPIAQLRHGDSVWSHDAAGRVLRAEVVDVISRVVGPSWPMLAIDGPDGTSFTVSDTHPLPDGTPLCERFTGTRVWSGHVGTTRTYDIRVDGPTGVYIVNGLALGSTLDPRHVQPVRNVA